MIKIHELNSETRNLLTGLTPQEVTKILDYAENIVVEAQWKSTHARIGCNSAVELVCSMLVWLDSYSLGKGNRNNG